MMVGISVRRNPNGITIHQNRKESYETEKEGYVSIRLDQDECNKVAQTIWEARRKYWKKEEKSLE